MRTSRLALCLLSFAVASMSAGVASAADVDLKGATTFATGITKIKIKDLGSCTVGFSLDVDFALENRRFTAVDNEGRVYQGKYKQKGKDGRKLKAKFNKRSRKELKRSVKSLVQLCADASKVSVDLDNTKIKAKINDTFDTIKIKGKAKVEGKADGQSGKAKYKFKATGSLNLAAE